MSGQGSVKTSKGHLQTFAWIAFALGAPQIFFLQHWEWFHNELMQDAYAAVIDALAQSLNGVVVICALVASRKLYSSSGKRLALATAGVWFAMLVLFEVGTFLTPYWHDPIGNLKYMIGLTPTTPVWGQWANLGGTISTIIWIFIAVKLGKLKNDVSPEPVYVQNQSAFISNAPTYQPAVIQQSAPHGNFCSHCGSKSSGPVGSFCSNCGARL